MLHNQRETRNRSKWGCNLRSILIDGQVLMAGPCQGLCECLHTHKTLSCVLCQRSQDHGFHGSGQRWAEVPERWRSHRQALVHDLPGVAFKWTLPAEPFVGDNAERVLVTGKAWFAA